VFVRSVLPEDSSLRVPKPAREPIVLPAFDWRPFILAAVAIIMVVILWRLWVWYRRRSRAPVDPFTAAEREFARIEGLGLISRGDQALHAALMSDAMREYLAARVAGIRRSHTSAELVANATAVPRHAQRIGELLWQADLVKFARHGIAADDARDLGESARKVVRTIEEELVAREKQRQEKAA
jgi:hypothetical protein